MRFNVSGSPVISSPALKKPHSNHQTETHLEIRYAFFIVALKTSDWSIPELFDSYTDLVLKKIS